LNQTQFKIRKLPGKPKKRNTSAKVLLARKSSLGKNKTKTISQKKKQKNKKKPRKRKTKLYFLDVQSRA